MFCRNLRHRPEKDKVTYESPDESDFLPVPKKKRSRAEISKDYREKIKQDPAKYAK
jgi:hypothetical protein